MRDYIDELISRYVSDSGGSETDTLIAQVFVYLQRHCPERIAASEDLTLASAVSALRKSAAVSRAEIAVLAGLDEAELGQWEAQVRGSSAVASRMATVLGSLLARARQALDVERQLPLSKRPAYAAARSSAPAEHREPLMAAIEKAKLRARMSGKLRSIDDRKCNWYRSMAHRADELLQTYALAQGLDEIPVPVPVDLIAELALKVDYYLDHMGNGDSGWFDPTARRICINADEPRTRQRYTFAHEIGHAVLHADKLVGAVHRDNVATVDESRIELTLDVLQALTANDLIQARASERELRQAAYRETEANVFAAALVMPTNQVCRMIDRGLTDSAALADYFGVSVAAVDWRLRYLDACMGMPEASRGSDGQGKLF